MCLSPLQLGIFLETPNTGYLKTSALLMRNNSFVLLKNRAIDISLLTDADAFNTSETNDELLQTHSAEHANMSGNTLILQQGRTMCLHLKKPTACLTISLCINFFHDD